METAGADAVVPPRRSWRGELGLRRARRLPRVDIGPGVRVGRGVVFGAAPGARLVIGPGVAIGDGARIEATGGTLRIGAGAVLGQRSILVGAVTVGRECVVGDWARAEGSAQLADRARLAARAVALTGARIGAGAVIGSFAVVDAAVPPRTVRT
jgi:carbonic anhydrase/acetyltransferase-like protein (isoleucine patch superfamily)